MGEFTMKFSTYAHVQETSLIWVLAFDLGLDYERDDDQYIKEAIQTIESRFDLVLITDRFEESVILLKGTD